MKRSTLSTAFILLVSAFLIGTIMYLIYGKAFEKITYTFPFIKFLPSFNVTMNMMSLAWVLFGIFSIHRNQVARHRFSMLMATMFSGFFLLGYGTYHAFHGSTPYNGTGWLRNAYYTILIGHIVSCILAVPMVLGTLYLALSHQYHYHKRLARFTYPTWIFVSITGIVVYGLLYTFG